MSLRVVCPNGHALSVNENMAGKSGLCPKCKARVKVPELRQDEFSEEAILSILGPQAKPQAAEAPVSAAGGANSPPKKSCRKCNQEISAGIHICPHCHTFIAEVGEI